MSTLEDLLRETLAEQEDDAPDDADLLSVVRGRAVRRHRQRRLAAGSVAVVALIAAGLAGGGLLATHRGSPSTGSSGGFARSDSLGTVSLVTSGDCAGLSVAAVLLSGDPEHPLRLAPFPAANAVRMSLGEPMWLQARGPCVTRLRVYITGFGLPVTGADGYAAFGSRGDAVIVADAEHGGHGTVAFYLDCPASAGCPPRVPPLAAITVDVIATGTPALGPTS
jgi:hypothetical protein